MTPLLVYVVERKFENRQLSEGKLILDTLADKNENDLTPSINFEINSLKLEYCIIQDDLNSAKEPLARMMSIYENGWNFDKRYLKLKILQESLNLMR